MRAFAPNGSPILGTLERLSGRAEVSEDSWTKNQDGTVDFEYQGGTEIFYDDQETRQTNDDVATYPVLKTALEAIVARIKGEWDHPALKATGPLRTPTTDDVLAFAENALATASGPTVRLFLSEDGNEWPEDQIVLIEDDDEEVP